MKRFCIPFTAQFYSAMPSQAKHMFAAHTVITVYAVDAAEARVKADAIVVGVLPDALKTADIFEEKI